MKSSQVPSNIHMAVSLARHLALWTPGMKALFAKKQFFGSVSFRERFENLPDAFPGSPAEEA